MELAKFLKKCERPTGPVPGEWLRAAKLANSSGSLFVGDPHLDPADAYVAKVLAGTYIVEARLRDLDGEWWVSRVRARLAEIEEPKLGKQIGETCTDLAAFAFYDLGVAKEAIAGDVDRYLKLLFKKTLTGCGVVQLKLKKTLPIAYVETRFDCGAAVFELRSGQRCVGVEIEIDFDELEADVAGATIEVSGPSQAPPLTQPAGYSAGVCIYCRGSGACYCIRKGLATAGCSRCKGSGKCHVCQGRGKGQ